jgi:hypothetical protein
MEKVVGKAWPHLQSLYLNSLSPVINAPSADELLDCHQTHRVCSDIMKLM